MQTADTIAGTRFGWFRLLMLTGLLLCMLAPAAAGAQGLKDDDEDRATEEATTEDDASDEPATEEELEDAGLVSESEYESPQFGYSLEWDGDWAVDSWYDDPANTPDGPSVTSDTGDEFDRIYLIWEDGNESGAYAIFSGQTANRGGPDGDVEEWLDDDYIAEQWNPEFDVEAIADDTRGDSGAVLYSVLDTDTDTQYFTLYQSTELSDGTTLYITFSTSEDYVEDGYTSFSEDIMLNGDPLELVMSVDDVVEAMEGQ